MINIHAPRKRAFILACLALSCLAVCIFFSLQNGNVVTAQSVGNQQQPENQPDNPPPTEASVLEKTETALKKIHAISMKYSGECSTEVVEVYTSSVNLLKTQIDALGALGNANYAEKTRLNDLLQPSERKMVVFEKYMENGGSVKQDKEWPGYTMYVLHWRKLKFRLEEIDESRVEIDNRKNECNKQLKQFNNSLSVCISILNGR